MNYKRTKFQVSQPISLRIMLCTCFRTNMHILLSEDIYKIYTGSEEDTILLERNYPEIFNRLVEGQFLIDKNSNEKEEWLEAKKSQIDDKSFYHIIVNPTLDCNLSCWYCYESKIKDSCMDQSTIDAICCNIETHFNESPYSLLKLSFFGGEPLMKPNVVKSFVDFADNFCKKNNIELMLDFTTNGTLLSEYVLNIIKDFRCQFQITLDGNKEQHNKIKFFKSSKVDAFSLTLKNIYRIQKAIPNSFVAVRINFDGETLKSFDSILEELKGLDRTRTMIIVKKVWQVATDEISKSLIFECLDKLFREKFIVDYYSQGGTCFADRKNQVTFNYDGNVFKCTTITSFDESNCLGKLDPSSGKLHWNKDKIKYLDNTKIAEICADCKALPSCGGHCRKHISEGQDRDCFLNNLGMSLEEYAKKQFMISLIKNKIYAEFQGN